MVRYLLTLCSLLLAVVPAQAGKVVMEQIATSSNVLFIDTQNAHVGLSTVNYGGAIPNVNLFTSSSVVVSSPTSTNNIVLYATGTVKALDFRGSGAFLTNLPAPTSIDLSTVTTALNLKADKGNTSHIDLSTVTTALAGKQSTTAPVPNANIDLSTVTTALSLKADKGNTSHIDLSTVTSALAGKLSNSAAISSTLIDLSTVTTALATKADKGNTSHIDLSTVTAALSGKLSSTAAISPTLIDLSTVTTALDGKAGVGSCIANRFVSNSAVGGPTCSQPSDVTGNAATVTTIPTLTGDVTSAANSVAIAPFAVVAGKIADGAVDTAKLNTTLQSQIAGAVQRAGDTMTGRLTAPDITIAGGLNSSTGSFSGNLGVGTTGPSSKAQIVGTLQISSAAYSAPTYGAGLELRYANDTLAGSPASYIFSYDRTNGAYKGLYLAASEFGFDVGGIRAQTIDPTGHNSFPVGVTVGSGTANVGVNVTGNYWSALSAQSGTKGVSLGWDSSQNMGIIAPWSTAGLDFWTYNGVGWGTRLTLEATGNLISGARILMNDASVTYGITASTGYFITNLGIGTASPGATLDVNGNAQFGSGATKSTFTTTGALTTAAGVYISTPSGTGNLRVRAGTGNGGGTTPIVLYSAYLSSTTQGTVGIMVAGEYIVPANTLTRVGDSLSVWCVARATSTSLSKDLYFYVGEDIGSGAATSTRDGYEADGTFFYQAAGNMIGRIGQRSFNQTGGTATVRGEVDMVMAVDMTADFPVRCKIKGTTAVPTNAGDEDMALLMMKVVFEPAP